MANNKITAFVIRSAIVASLGGLLFGFDTAVISGTTEALKDVFALSDWELGFTVACALFGTIFGAATIQIPTNRFGRKPTLIAIALLYLISAIGSAFPWDWYSFMFFRFIGGIGVGGASVVSPLYTAEISPPKRRGLLVALTQFNIVLGILLAYISNYIIASCNLGATEWRWMFGVEAVPAFLFLVALFVNPESPRWLVGKNRIDEARKIFIKLVGDEGAANEELGAVEKSLREERAVGKERLFCWRYRKLIFLAICIAAFNQLSGINAILYYAPKVFLLAGADKSTAMFLPTIIGVVNFIVTALAIFVIDKFGRKTLMLAGSIGFILSLGLVGTLFTAFSAEFDEQISKIDAQEAAVQHVEEEEGAFVKTGPEGIPEGASASQADAAVSTVKAGGGTQEIPPFVVYGVLVGLMVFIASHGFGQGACIWVFLSEIFPNGVRAQGQALGSFTHWFFNAVVSGLFPPVLGLIGPSAIFFMFAGFMVLQLLWVVFMMPETKQVPLEEMQKRLGITES
ncbi:MAG: sugar porter family MFS transporter [Thermoguttaceae bacterium]